MCGIFAILNNNETIEENIINENFNKAQHRGPDNSSINLSNNNYVGFHRLQINGLDEISNQPFIYDNILLVCNGEIYNFRELYKNINYKPTTNSDCEVIIYLYLTFGIEYTLNLLDGVFAFILFDYNISKIFIARDVYGVRPLFYLYNNMLFSDLDSQENKNNLIGFASEVKQLSGILNTLNSDYYNKVEDNINNFYVIKPCVPGECLILDYSENNKWYLLEKLKYDTFKKNKCINFTNENYDLENIYSIIRNKFIEAVKKRVDATDRPIACLLSGGLDSSIVASLVSKFYNKQLETYSIGLEGGEDLKYAKIVADHIGSNHTEIIVNEDDFFNQIPNVIEKIESYDTTTVRASVGNYLISKYISENSDAKVIFNGDGSDELMGGYLYMKACPNHLEFDRETKNLLKNIHYFDVLRSDRSISTNGLEPRTPFLDRSFVDYYLSIPSEVRYEMNKKQEKYIFRKAFDTDDNFLPEEILWRRKEAFSDGVSKKERSWFEIIKENVETQQVVKYNLDEEFVLNKPETIEQLYYRTIFESFYPGLAYLIPYFWMPKYIESDDASARTLDIY